MDFQQRVFLFDIAGEKGECVKSILPQNINGFSRKHFQQIKLSIHKKWQTEGLKEYTEIFIQKLALHIKFYFRYIYLSLSSFQAFSLNILKYENNFVCYVIQRISLLGDVDN